MNKFAFDKIEFYITNVCNLNCENCNRFNNYSFSGWQRWSDYENIYRRWSDHIDIKHIVILGGEPLLNPDIVEWAQGLKTFFKSTIQILSNGTQLNKVKGLYDVLRTHAWLGISWHNPNTLDDFEQELKQFLKGDIVKLAKSDPRNKFPNAHAVWRDSNGVTIPLWIQYDFYDSAVKKTYRGALTLHDSDPQKAHDVCGFVKAKNYHFIKGKLYKCGPVALFPEFDQQHNLEISNEDRDLINSYQPLTLEGYISNGSSYFGQLDKTLPQCKFCPEKIEPSHRLFAVSKNLAKKQTD